MNPVLVMAAIAMIVVLVAIPFMGFMMRDPDDAPFTLASTIKCYLVVATVAAAIGGICYSNKSLRDDASDAWIVAALIGVLCLILISVHDWRQNMSPIPGARTLWQDLMSCASRMSFLIKR